ncbi:hypothetical protein [Clostridium akagii]|uniref:hypothetical protein n=1 Tax=Clostridium akagii TaxID=91623 RepID=UPI00047B573F|nr:hypothetical protein [Clostridium akagii]
MSYLDSLIPNDLAVLATAISIVLTEDKSASENNVLGNFISSVGASISTIASKQELVESLEDKQKKLNQLKSGS